MVMGVSLPTVIFEALNAAFAGKAPSVGLVGTPSSRHNLVTSEGKLNPLDSRGDRRIISSPIILATSKSFLVTKHHTNRARRWFTSVVLPVGNNRLQIMVNQHLASCVNDLE